MSAPRPLPRPDLAMRLRLPEHLYQGKQQSAQSNIDAKGGPDPLSGKKNLKKVLTLES